MSTPRPEQVELDLGIDYGWFHIMRPRLLAGLIAEIGETAWAVYTIIKAHAEHHTGQSWPSQERIGQLVGKSAETVGSATKTLVKHGLLAEEKRGRHKVYTVLEQAPMTHRYTGAPVGSADFAYVPKEFAGQLQALKSFIQDGVPPGRGITLNLTVNLVQQGDNGTVNLQNIQVGSPEMGRAQLADLRRRLKALND